MFRTAEEISRTEPLIGQVSPNFPSKKDSRRPKPVRRDKDDQEDRAPERKKTGEELDRYV